MYASTCTQGCRPVAQVAEHRWVCRLYQHISLIWSIMISKIDEVFLGLRLCRIRPANGYVPDSQQLQLSSSPGALPAAALGGLLLHCWITNVEGEHLLRVCWRMFSSTVLVVRGSLSIVVPIAGPAHINCLLVAWVMAWSCACLRCCCKCS